MRVALVQPHLPHYRRPFFEALLESQAHEYSLFHGARSGAGQSGVAATPLPGATQLSASLLRFGSRSVVVMPQTLWHVGRGRFDSVVLGSIVGIPTNVPLVATCRFLGSKLIIWTNTWHQHRGSALTRLQSAIEMGFCRRASGVIAYTGWAKGQLIAGGVNAERIRVIGNAVDVREIEASEEEIRRHGQALRRALCPNNEPLVVTVGKVAHEKRWKDLLVAHRELSSRRPVVTAVVGGGPDFDQLLARAGDLGSPNLKVIGKVPAGRELPWFAAASVVVFPGHSGLALNQAAALGCPVVASDTLSAEAEILRSGENCLRFPAGDVESLVQRIDEVLSSGEEAESLGEALRVAIQARPDVAEMVSAFDRAVSEIAGID